ncbi:hypothetical protein Ddc_15936 [Ditylenchus destructor]|nr:hypothetical protein Ddc_15936 [Ditylenchus destructor]
MQSRRFKRAMECKRAMRKTLESFLLAFQVTAILDCDELATQLALQSVSLVIRTTHGAQDQSFEYLYMITLPSAVVHQRVLSFRMTDRVRQRVIRTTHDAQDQSFDYPGMIILRSAVLRQRFCFVPDERTSAAEGLETL